MPIRADVGLYVVMKILERIWVRIWWIERGTMTGWVGGMMARARLDNESMRLIPKSRKSDVLTSSGVSAKDILSSFVVIACDPPDVVSVYAAGNFNSWIAEPPLSATLEC